MYIKSVRVGLYSSGIPSKYNDIFRDLFPRFIVDKLNKKSKVSFKFNRRK
jgi:hypothetical protein